MVFDGARNKPAGIMAIIGGILLTISGSIGMVAILKFLKDVLDNMGMGSSELSLAFKIMILLAAFGGLTVILGGLLIFKNFFRSGRFLIMLGAGMGLIGLIIQVIVHWRNGTLGEFEAWMTSSVQGIGILLSIAAAKIAK